MDTSGAADTSGEEELWTTGQAAAYLKDLGIKPRQVARMVSSGDLPGVQLGAGKWRRVRAADVRALRKEMLDTLATRQRKETS